MSFNNMKQIEEYIISKSKVVLEQYRDKVFSVLEDFMLQYYQEFTPEYYERTFQLLQSCVKTDVVPNGNNGWKAEVYFDWSNLDYSVKYFRDSRWKVEGGYINPFSYSGMISPDGSFPNNGDPYKVTESAMHGSHGGKHEGTAVWDESIKLLKQNFRKDLKQYLKNNGIPVR